MILTCATCGEEFHDVPQSVIDRLDPKGHIYCGAGCFFAALEADV